MASIKEEIKQGNKLCLIEEIRTWINANENNDNCDEYQLADRIKEIIRDYEI